MQFLFHCYSTQEMWSQGQAKLSSEYERRLAYLPYHCGLKHEESGWYRSLEWSNVHEVTRLQRIILERLMKGLEP